MSGFFIDTRVCFLLGILGYFVLLFRWKYQRTATKQIVYFSVLYAYIVFLISVTFFPVNVFFVEEKTFFQLRLLGFVESVKLDIAHGMYLTPIKQIGGNLILLMPLGFLLPIKYGLPKSPQGIMLYAFSVSLLIETLQLLLTFLLPGNYRVFDIDDLWLNAVGFIMGFYIFKFFTRMIPTIIEKIRP